MSNTAMLQSMLAQNTKILDRYISQNNHDQVAIWTEKVNKVRAQLGEPPLGGGAPAGAPAAAPQQQYGAPAQQEHTYDNRGPPPNQYQAPPATNQYSAPPPAASSYQAPQHSYQAPQASYGGDPMQKLDQEMQELRSANAKLREQLAQREDAISRDARMHTLETADFNARHQELMAGQQKFDSHLAEKQKKMDDILREQSDGARRNDELVAQQTVKSAQTLRDKDTEIEAKNRAIEHANTEYERLNADLIAQGESAETHIRILTGEKDRLQEAVDHSRAQVVAKQTEIEQIQRTLAGIAKQEEEESLKLNEFVQKSIKAIKLAADSSTDGNIVISSKANVGFADLTITTVVNK